MSDETHLLILGPHSAKTACGTHVVAIYPHLGVAQPADQRPHITYTILPQVVTCQECAAVLERPADIRQVSERHQSLKCRWEEQKEGEQ